MKILTIALLLFPLLAFARGDVIREVNLNDQEVREIQSVVREIYPGSIVNIASVTVGCNCEEGPTCTEQVWVVSYLMESMEGLRLSKIDGKWTIGILQKWKLYYEKYRKRLLAAENAQDDFESYEAWRAHVSSVYDSYKRRPVCPEVAEERKRRKERYRKQQLLNQM